jgi:glutamyl/glutaminyl-tRNA synthetase
MIWEAIGESPRPEYAHIPLILAENREKISKRKHGEIVSVEYYRKNGYVPEALLNFLALLGWNPGHDQEIIGIDEMIEKFSLDKVQKAGAIFNQEKLLWFNRQYIQKMSECEFTTNAKPFLPEWISIGGDIFKRLYTILRDKTHKFSDISALFEVGGELSFVKELPVYDKAMLLWKKNPSAEIAVGHLKTVINLLNTMENKDDFSADNIKSAIWNYAEEKGRGDVLWPFRVALTGQEKSPDPFTSAYILGREECLRRIEKAIKLLE